MNLLGCPVPGIRPSPFPSSSTKRGRDQQPPWSWSGLSHRPTALWDGSRRLCWPQPRFPACLRGGGTRSSIALPKSSYLYPLLRVHKAYSGPVHQAGCIRLPGSLKLTVINDLLKITLSLSKRQICPFPAQKHRLMGTESLFLLVPLLCRAGCSSRGRAQLTGTWTRAGAGHEPAGSRLPRALQKWGTAGLILRAQLMGERAVQWGAWGRAGSGHTDGAELLQLAQVLPKAGLKGGSSQSWPLLG